MSGQRIHGVVVLTVALATCSVHCWQFGPGREIPPRCRRPSVTPVSCADTAFLDNLLPHPDDCRLFYYCVSPAARPVCRQCPARLHFNPRLRVCDHPAVAGCRPPSSTTALPPDPTTEHVASTASAESSTQGADTQPTPTVEPTTASTTVKPTTDASTTVEHTNPPTEDASQSSTSATTDPAVNP